MTTSQLLIRLATASFCAAILGIERETAGGHAAGFRTHTLVGLGACLFTLAGGYGFSDIPRTSDPARIAAQVASGIGFVGAGAILRDGQSIRGLTTAATLWLAAAIGVTAGAGSFTACIVACGIAAVLLIARRTARRYGLHWLLRKPAVVTIEYTVGHGTLGPIIRGLEHAKTHVQSIRLDDHDDFAQSGTTLRRVEVTVRARDWSAVDDLIADLHELPEIHSIEVAR